MASMLFAYGAAFGEGPSVMAEVLPYAALRTQLRNASVDNPPIPKCSCVGGDGATRVQRSSQNATSNDLDLPFDKRADPGFPRSAAIGFPGSISVPARA